MAGGFRAEIKDGDKVALALKAAKVPMRKELRRSNAATAKLARGVVRGAAQGGSRQQRRMSTGIRSTGTPYSAIISVNRTSRAPGALGAFYGAKKFRQFPNWVGNTWKPLTKGEGPQPINDALASKAGEIEEIYLQGQLDAVARVLPNL